MNQTLTESDVQERLAVLDGLREAIGRAVVGQAEVIEQLLVALLAGGHCMLEGVPGLGKTLLVRTLGEALELEFRRVQFTPDLMPSDILGTELLEEDHGTGHRSFRFQKGPVFTNLLLADELNRTPPRTQAALLEAMQERTVSYAGVTHALPAPFFVLATQNPIEQEGTYPLPEAQVDRFMLKVVVGYPTREEEKEIMRRMSGGAPIDVGIAATPGEILQARKTIAGLYLDDKIGDYILDLVGATRDPKAFGLADLAPLIEFGASPRATLALASCARAHAYLRGRGYVIPEDVKAIAHDVLRHRVIVTYEAEAEEVTSDEIVRRVLEAARTP